jgi:hypothetical protein
MKERDPIQEELEQLSPALAKLRKQGRRKAPVPPADYYEQLSDRVMGRIAEEERSPLKVVSKNWGRTRQLSYTWASLAAALLLALGVSLYLFLPQDTSTDHTLASLSDAEAQSYIEHNIDEFEIGLMLEAELVQMEDAELPVELLPEIGEEEAEEYLYDLLEEEDLEAFF